jgi:hypothetical protein
VRFAFVSCQNVNQGAQNAFRRMIFEDERAAKEEDRIDFVLHLGDFIYEIVWYPEDRPKGMYDRRLRDVARYASGEKISDFHVPTTVDDYRADDYRAVYKGYLHDPDIQDARARWPFVAMWDNHEFSLLLITDQYSFRSEDPGGRPETDPLSTKDFPDLVAEEVLEILDAGREFDGGKPPAKSADVPLWLYDPMVCRNSSVPARAPSWLVPPSANYSPSERRFRGRPARPLTTSWPPSSTRRATLARVR